MTNEKLEEWIAVNVMNWTICSKTKFPSASDGNTYYVRSHGIMRRYMDDRGSQDTFWNPTTSPSDTFPLMEKCRQLCGCVYYETKFTEGDNYYNFRGTFENHGWIEGHAKTPELALCVFTKKLFSKKGK